MNGDEDEEGDAPGDISDQMGGDVELSGEVEGKEGKRVREGEGEEDGGEVKRARSD